MLKFNMINKGPRVVMSKLVLTAVKMFDKMVDAQGKDKETGCTRA